MFSLGELRRCLETLSAPVNQTGRAARRRRRRARARGRAITATAANVSNQVLPFVAGAQAGPVPLPRRRRRRRNRNLNGMPRSLTQGEVTVTRRELLQISKRTGTVLAIAPHNFTWLKNISKVFGMIHWVSLSFEYRPMVGTTSAGAAAMGVDWGSNEVKSQKWQNYLDAEDVDRGKILALTPSYDGPVWQPCRSMPVPASLLHARMWFDIQAIDSFNTAPGYLVFLSTVDNAGEIWVYYTVQLAGTQPL